MSVNAPAVATQPFSGKSNDAAVLKPAAPERLTSLDVYRGAAMMLMASEGLRIAAVAQKIPESAFWAFLAYHTDHVAWSGCCLWDLIQPSFMFMTGVSLPYSIASRRAKGDSFQSLLGHAAIRSLILIFLGVFFRSVGEPQTNFIFTDVLSQIGLGYIFLFLLGWTSPRTQLAAAGAILVGYWAAFALYPLPPQGFDTRTVGVPADWKYQLSGFAAHWNKNTNIAHHFDTWFLNLFPRSKPFLFSNGGYQTLNFIPSLATMIFGLLAGNILKSDRSGFDKFKTLLIAAFIGLTLGTILDVTGICPSVKRIWTPAWTLYSSGWTFLLLAIFYGIIDLQGYRRWSFPLLVIGMNSIAMYSLAHVDSSFHNTLRTHLGKSFFAFAGAAYTPMLEQIAILFSMWLIILWMHQRKIFLRI